MARCYGQQVRPENKQLADDEFTFTDNSYEPDLHFYRQG